MDKKPYILKDLLLLTLIICVLFGAFLGSRALMVPDEGRYAEIPREMVVANDYLTPHLANLKYFEKPPLYYWITALPIKLFGANEWSVRAPTALLGLIGCLFIYWLALQLYGRRTALLSAFVLSSSVLYCIMSHLLTPDLPLTVFLTITFGCFILGTREPPGKARLIYFLSMYACAALATLTKGLIGFVLPGFVIFMWILLFNEWRSLKSYYLLRGALLFLAITAPWHILMQLEHPEFFHFYFIEQHFLRYLTDYAERSKPAWFLTSAVVLGFFPWIWFLLTAPFSWARREYFSETVWLSAWFKRHAHRETIFLVLWALLIYLFFNMSDSQLLSYALPVMPPLAILAAYYLSSCWDKGYTTALNTAFIAIFVCGFTTSVIGFFVVHPMEVTLHSANYWYASCIILGLSMLAMIMFYWKRGLKAGVITLFISMALTLISVSISYETIDNRSIKPLALELKPMLSPDTLVLAYDNYYQDLPVYLDRTVQLVDYRGELAFGIDQQQGQSVVWDKRTAWNHWRQDAVVFMFMSLKRYRHIMECPTEPIKWKEVTAWKNWKDNNRPFKIIAFDDFIPEKTCPIVPALYPVAQTTRHILLANQSL